MESIKPLACALCVNGKVLFIISLGWDCVKCKTDATDATRADLKSSVVYTVGRFIEKEGLALLFAR